MLEGTVIKLYKGYYYVKVGSEILICKLRGKFRFEKQNVLVGDKVKIKESESTYIIHEVLDRQSQLIRPPISNVDQAVIVLAVRNPEANLELLDRILVWAEYQKLNIIICLNKVDLADKREIAWSNIYDREYTVILTSVVNNIGLQELKRLFYGKISVLIGQSGVGKSSIINALYRVNLNTGDVGRKGYGRHTTRHLELIPIDEKGFIADTPGFSSIDLPDIEVYELANYFRDFKKYVSECHFDDCTHNREPKCAIKKALEQGEISDMRYMNYLRFLNELTERKMRYR